MPKNKNGYIGRKRPSIKKLHKIKVVQHPQTYHAQQRCLKRVPILCKQCGKYYDLDSKRSKLTFSHTRKCGLGLSKWYVS